MMDKVQTAFRLSLKTINRLDALVERPPDWLNACCPNPVKDRTDAIERLIFLAEKHSSFGMGSDANHEGEDEPTKPKRKKR